jgi:small subunit ribosomal protein S4
MFEKPKRPYDKKNIELERKILSKYGLRRKREIWKAESMLRNFRRRARELQAKPDEKKEHELLKKLQDYGILKKDAKIDDVLSLEINAILKRRLQSIVKKKYAKTMKQARQLIVHRHVLMNNQKLKWPSTLIKREDEAKIKLTPEGEKIVSEEKSKKKKSNR